MDLPNGWTATTLRAVADWSSGGTPSRKRAEFFGGDIPWVKTGELTEKYVRETEEMLTELGVKNSSARVFPKGSVGIAMYGATIGKVSIWGIDTSTNQACAVARPINGVVSSEFLYHFLRSEKAALVGEGKGGAQPNISQGLLKAWPIVLPPLNEQRRIVARIEALFDEIDRGVESLHDTKRAIRLYRQSLLKSAFEGRLTADWRAEKSDKLESSEALLARIREQREERHQASLDEWKRGLAEWERGGQSGKRPSKPRRSRTPSMPEVEESSRFGALPDGWLRLTAESVGTVQLGRQRSPKKRSKHFPTKYIRAANITEQGLALDDLLDMDFLPHELNAYRLKKGDLLLSEASGSAAQVGKAAIWANQVPNCCFQNTVIRHQPYCRDFAVFLLWLYRYFYVSGKFAQVAGGVGINHLSASRFAQIPLPICSPAEQAEIVRILDTRLEAVDSLDKEVDANLARAEALRQSILKKAFSGELVSQDPDDEPAQALLARIRSSRSEDSTAGLRRRTRRRASTPLPP